MGISCPEGSVEPAVYSDAEQGGRTDHQLPRQCECGSKPKEGRENVLVQEFAY